MMRCLAWLAVLLMIPLCSGCVVGYDSVLFATKSNVGFDFDSAPPTAELAISRVEGVVEPTFEGGKTLPVMASFKVRGEGLFAGGVGQTFTTGEAAVIMATLYGDKFSNLGENLNWKTDVESKFDSALVLSAEPKVNINGISFATTDVKPVFFGTTTSLGLKVSWSGMSGPSPDSLHLGYKRKELAWAPVSMEVEELDDGDTADQNGEDDTGKKQWHMRVPSLLATIDASGDAKTTDRAEFDWLQYFATGRSASALALRQEVRQAMLSRLDPSAAFDSIPGVVLSVEQAKLPLTREWDSLNSDPTANAATIAIFDEEAARIPPGFDDFEDFATSANTVEQVQQLRAALEARGITFDNE
jgi:hypothetical protein